MGSTVTIPLDAPNPSVSGRQRATGLQGNPRQLPDHPRHGPEGWEPGKGSNLIQTQLGIKTKGRNHGMLPIKSKDGPFSHAAEGSWLGKATPSAPKPPRIPPVCALERSKANPKQNHTKRLKLWRLRACERRRSSPAKARPRLRPFGPLESEQIGVKSCFLGV